MIVWISHAKVGHRQAPPFRYTLNYPFDYSQFLLSQGKSSVAGIGRAST
jgi:hypothetical protein